MKIVSIFISFLFLASRASGNEKIYTASTPANTIVRSFLGILPEDSIDFIRWKLVLRSDSYQLYCNYGISKPNTNGFIEGGKKIELRGSVKKEKNYSHLKNGVAVLTLIELNINLLQIAGTDNSLLVGNGGWSYTLNNTKPVVSDKISFQAKQILLVDSLVFDGRTPCDIPGIVPAGNQCYKLKWSITLYAGKEKSNTGRYKISGTAWRKENGLTGNWKIITGKNNRILYQLNDDKGNKVLNLLRATENIFLFVDADGNPLTGNEDFSYTLNRK